MGRRIAASSQDVERGRLCLHEVIIMDELSGLREGYAEVGDQRLHYVEAGEGPLILLLHGFPEFWYGWRQQIEPLAAAGFRVVAPDLRGYNLSSKPTDVAAYATDQLTADIRGLINERGANSALLVGHDWGRNRRLGHRDAPPRGRRPAGHPQRGPPAEALAGTAPPGPAPQVLVLLLLRTDLGAARSLPRPRTGRARPRRRTHLDRVERLPDASHWVHHDEHERVTQLLIDFFAPARPADNR
jgi:pimeloyl-ACP methyl ester carboxylesterase